jgi:hypothetical protein
LMDMIKKFSETSKLSGQFIQPTNRSIFTSGYDHVIRDFDQEASNLVSLEF